MENLPNRVGQQLGNYQLIRMLGRGGFAEVYLGKHLHLKTQAAIKLLHGQLTGHNVRHFTREAQIIASLQHPHILRVLDFGVDTSTPYLIMEYASGGTLRQRYPSGSIVPLSNVTVYVKQVAAALQYAHNHKLIHRDVKPENMLLLDKSVIALSDFGIAALAHSTSSIEIADTAGTAHYMAPEQIQGKPHPASDQYSLAVVVYEWLMGQQPFSGTSFIEIAMRHLQVPPLPPRSLIPTFSPEVEQVILIGLDKDPHCRFATVQAFANALEQAAGQTQLSTNQQAEANKATPPYTELTTPQLQSANSYLNEIDMPDYFAWQNNSFLGEQVSKEPPSINMNTDAAKDGQKGLRKQATNKQQVVPAQQLSQPILLPRERSVQVSARPASKRPVTRRTVHQIIEPIRGLVRTSSSKQPVTRHTRLIATLITFLLVISAVLIPVLLSKRQILIAKPPASVGQIAFTSSGQLDPTSSQGLNDIVTVNLHNLSAPAGGKSLFAWLLPDPSDDNTQPLFLGKLAIVGRKTQLTYADPNHRNLLASYSGFQVTEQPSNQVPTTPPLDPKTWRYIGSIPNIPTPGDKNQYSLLDHTRHLLAKDPTLQTIGLVGGLDIWLYRNTEKILEWSSAARDSWAGGQQTDLIYRHMIRVLDYLDGAAYVYNSGDLPADAPLLVDPQAGRIGLLEVSQTQTLPAYLTHVALHLQGIMNAPGHTQEQRQLAVKIDTALEQVTSLMQKIHQDAVTLVKMDQTQLQSQDALTLLNDMVTNANNAYAGQPDPATGENTNGIVWIHSQLQKLAIIPVTAINNNMPLKTG